MLQALDHVSVLPAPAEWLVGGGEIGLRMREMDWSHTLLGSPCDWPTPLKVVARVVLASREPLCVWWGADCSLIYNDACAPLVGGDPSRSLGLPAPSAWLEGPSRIRVALQCDGVAIERQYALSISPVPGEGGGLGGVLCAFFDVTRASG